MSVRLHKRTMLSLLFALAAVAQGGSAAYIAVKAELAQWLLEQAWQHSDGGLHAIKPWAWADTWPTARLSLPRQHYEGIVLAGASGRNLAFGPAHVDGTAWPGEDGHVLIAAHRDTHFEVLENVAVGDVVAIERLGRRYDYQVSATCIAIVPWISSTNLASVKAWPSLPAIPSMPSHHTPHGAMWCWPSRACWLRRIEDDVV